MMHRLFIASIAAMIIGMSVAHAAANVAQIRITTRTHQSTVVLPANEPVYPDGYFVPDGQEWWLGNGPYASYYGYPPCINGSSNYDIVPSPYLTTAPVVVPPLLARPVSPPPMIIRRSRGGWIVEPDPHFQRMFISPYPLFQTAGSAIYNPPLPSYNFNLRIPVRRHR